MRDCAVRYVRDARRYGSIRVRGLGLAVWHQSCPASALPAAAAAQTNDTWTGAGTTSAWSNAANWTAGVPPTSAGILTFPTLTGCAAPKTCYTSKNGLTGVSATGLVFSNTAGQYKIQGNSLTVGASGITDNPGGSRGDLIQAPLVLGAPQTWAVGKGTGTSYNSLTLTAGVTGSLGACLDVPNEHGSRDRRPVR